MNTTIGTGQRININPIPNNGDTIFVEATPFDGYGCSDIFIGYLFDTLSVVSFAGTDTFFCANASVQLGKNAIPGEIYNWSPAQGLSNPHISNPIATPFVTTNYTVTTTSPGGGCRSIDNVRLIKKCDVIEVYVPKAFTPNGNAVNDRLKPQLYGFSRLNYFRIHIRYGQLIYQAGDNLMGWDGTI